MALQFHRLVLVALAATTLSGPLLAQSVGVTSATAGDPLGKPPTERERVLHVGIDVKANELITTGPADRAHLVFLDGTSLTVGPQARLSIDRFVYDPNKKTGELAINATQGVFRLVGGKISKTQPITVTTPSSTLTIRGGIMLFTVQPQMTSAVFVFGWELIVGAAGKTQSVKTPGWKIVTEAGKPPLPAVQLPPGGLEREMAQLEGKAGTNQGGANADQVAKDSGFADQNSGQGPGSTTPNLQGGPNPNAANAINNAGNQTIIKSFDKGPDPNPKTRGK
jgi:hypothetical protein